MSDMKRREFITLLGGAAAAPMIWPRSACAQQDGPVARVGVIGPPLDYPAMRVAYPFFLADLRKLGFVEGRNLLVETRPVDESVPRVFAAANELVAWKADVLFAFGPELALQAAVAAHPPVPIVMGAANFDPIAKGYVQSLARPGGSVTGIISRWPEVVAKQIELLQEAFPDRNRIGVLWDTQSADQFSAAEREAKARRLVLRPLKLENPPYDFTAAFHTLAQADVQMLMVLSSPLFSRQNAQIASLAIEHRLPAMFILKHYVEAGGLMSYGVDFAPLMRRAASFVAKILRGAKPADLPVEQATHFEFVLNLKTAKAMGLTLLTSTLLRADEVIE
jgi:putative tryptophan/tyrosine transport system substrate-binding protein